MKIQFLQTAGLEPACHAMRLSFDSVSKMESRMSSAGVDLWEDDVILLRNLVARGDSHAKVMRMAIVWMDVTAPRYWWQEFDQCKVGTTTMSSSTMHTLSKRDLVSEDFEGGMVQHVLDGINIFRAACNSHTPKYQRVYEMKRRLPESFLQKRTVCLNYQVLRHIYFDRKNHKLPEWHTFLSAMSLLPFYEQFVKVDRVLDLSE